LTHPPAPLLNFFARFLETPDGNPRDFLVALLDLEVSRAQYNVLPNLSEMAMGKVTEICVRDIVATRRILNLARLEKGSGIAQPDLQYQWLTLLGHRLAVEHGLSVVGIAALVHVASMRLDLPLEETKSWYADTLFEHYTQTVLREEWDYVGIRFRNPGSARPPEER